LNARAALALALAACLLASCAPRRRAPPGAAPGAEMALYRAALHAEEGERRRFRLLLWAEAPDRFHAEALTPVGGTAVILDGGGGRMSVVVPGERAAWAGAADADVLERVIGVRVGLEDLVGLLPGRGGSPPEGYEVERAPPGPGLPRTFALRGGGGSLALERRRLEPLRVSTDALGTGSVPPGLDVRPLEELGQVALPDEPAP